MRMLILIISLVILFGCDEKRVYETNVDFDNRLWTSDTKPIFEFEINDPQMPYNLYCNVRNTVSFPYSRIFFKYSLSDSTQLLKNDMVSAFLFDKNTGEPLGNSGVGDIYDQRVQLLSNYRFPSAGKFKIQFEQYMRMDSLKGILAVGLRVEKATNE